ncbi:hypothetical protein C0V97_08640 [Asaia sp. W19]|uniref:glycoside hydrolase family 99-like domain-containing protein n=1 Tax=unclassified Asaia TaxID=2685023 RepID=UPI000F8C38D3|nr:glycoside hydrolase family 99-like domain-containing protein [Asaia sp. W19]RUT25902.1 hypothetical protein C0V97_08640 [Asaia sp. W19]
MPTVLRCIGHSGLFDTAFYLSRNPDLQDLGSGALAHYHSTGWREGRKPNPFFDPGWYLARYRDVTEDPLHHYLTRGEYEGRRPVPWFDPIWYRQANQVPVNMNALAHYLANRRLPDIHPMPEFDPVFYLQNNPDVAASGMDPVEHYMVQGFREARRPFAGFDPAFYRQRYLRHQPEVNAFLHWLDHRHEPGIFPALPAHETTIAREIRRRTQPAAEFEEHQPLPDASLRRARVLAYYLPQFHPVEANDRWWGKGFTEWTNLSRGVPRFADHYQPRTPRDLGHYRLDSAETLRRQAKMAHESGVEGFIFYHYWFNGTRLLEQPMEILLRSPEISLPFCLMWANENWSRRWDGGDQDILISQDYRCEDDEALIADFARHMRDPRYIRFGERPVLMIYRPGAIPKAQQRLRRWRALFREQEGIMPVFVMAQAFDDHDPRHFGMDAAIEFPPHKLTCTCTPIEDRLDILDQDMTARVYDYAELVDKALADPAPAFPLIRTVSPSWDNDARRQGAGLVLHGSTPALYERWLSETIEKARDNPVFGETLVCINAWNEWAEGAYLEPDVHYGAAYLNATARAVTRLRGGLGKTRLLLIGHDAFPAGAQMLLLSLGKALQRNHGLDIAFLLLGGGEMLPQYRQVATVEILRPGEPACRERLASLRIEGFGAALMNSAVTTVLTPDLVEAGIPFTLLIHELPGMIRHHDLERPLAEAMKRAFGLIVPGAMLTRICPNAHILPQGLYNPVTFTPEDRLRVRQAYGIPALAHVVIGVGYGDTRKGFDLFLQLWSMLRSPSFTAPINGQETVRPIHFLWVGALSPAIETALESDLKPALDSGNFHLPGRVDNVSPFLSAADQFVLTSREDPYPSAALEALASGLPCAAFARCGMIPDLLETLASEGDTRHAILQPGDLPALGSLILKGARLPPTARGQRSTLGTALRARFSFDAYAAKVLGRAMPDLPWISVVVLSYNYARYLVARLATIFAQDCPVLEIIVLDDCSQDGSADLAEQTAEAFARGVRIIRQTRQSGSVFAQWQRAAEIAQGNWIWIAEADDLSEPEFLSSLGSLAGQVKGAVMAFCDSRPIDGEGISLGPDYQDYYRSHVGAQLGRDMVMPGQDFVRNFLGHANLILNVSAVLFRREAFNAALSACMAELGTYRLAGDWRVYLEILMQPGAQIAYLARPLNIHRRHQRSVTGALDESAHLAEIERLHDEIATRFGRAEDLMQAQKLYRDGLRRQFGLEAPPRARLAQ